MDKETVYRDQNFRALTTDTKLTNKTEELKIATAHLNEQKQQHVGRGPRQRTLQQSEKMPKMMDHYRTELQSQTKL
ncbi:hypothetical protein RP20_CCG010614 [Aedes albopictus]|nr:hypothetical protein RP20_CCG010614 [Aedes albopictus]